MSVWDDEPVKRAAKPGLKLARQMLSAQRPFSARVPSAQRRKDKPSLERPLAFLANSYPPPPTTTRPRRTKLSTKPLRDQINTIRSQYREYAATYGVDPRDKSARQWLGARGRSRAAKRNVEAILTAWEALDQMTEFADWVDAELSRYQQLSRDEKRQRQDLDLQLMRLRLPVAPQDGLSDLVGVAMLAMQTMAPMLADGAVLIGAGFQASAEQARKQRKRDKKAPTRKRSAT